MKILKEWIEISIGNAPEWVKSDEIIKIIDYKQIQAIENLIKGYRELEAKLNQLLKYEDDLRIKERAFCKENHIPKSKIKEKIEELEKQYKQMEQTSDFIIADIIQPKIQVLQELMEEE